MVKHDRLKIFMAAHDLTDAKLADELGVSESSIRRYRTGKLPLSRLVAFLIKRAWPLWWDFLTEQSNVLPNPQPQPEPVRLVEEEPKEAVFPGPPVAWSRDGREEV